MKNSIAIEHGGAGQQRRLAGKREGRGEIGRGVELRNGARRQGCLDHRRVDADILRRARIVHRDAARNGIERLEASDRNFGLHLIHFPGFLFRRVFERVASDLRGRCGRQQGIRLTHVAFGHLRDHVHPAAAA